MKNYKGFYKVAENNGGVCTGVFFNPDTLETFSKITWDIDRPYINDDEEIEILRYLPIDENIRRIYLHHKGQILTGDKVEIFKGRKMPVGYTGIVKDIKPYKDRYGRTQAYYIYFEDGQRTNYNNCRLVKAN